MRTDKGWLWGTLILGGALIASTFIGTCYNTKTTKRNIDTAATEVLDGIQASQGHLDTTVTDARDSVVSSICSASKSAHKDYSRLSGQLAAHDEDDFEQYTILSGKQDNLAGQVDALGKEMRFEQSIVESLIATGHRNLVGRGVFGGVYRDKKGKVIGKTDGRIDEFRLVPEDTTAGVKIEYSR
jgi:outer membrane murein-binding lipoprotein Lpp